MNLNFDALPPGVVDTGLGGETDVTKGELDQDIADLEGLIRDFENDPGLDPSLPVDRVLPLAITQPLIGVIDTGFAAQNSDLNFDRILLGSDRVEGDANPLGPVTDPTVDHGTAVLEVIAATRNNGIGIDGMNPDAPVWLGRAVGSGQWAESLKEFVDRAQADGHAQAVVNLSFDLTEVAADGTVTTRTAFTQAEREALTYARDHNVLVVVSAGNEGSDNLSALAAASREFSNVVTVGATDNGDRASYSNYGAGLDLVTDGSRPADLGLIDPSPIASPNQTLLQRAIDLPEQLANLGTGNPLPDFSDQDAATALATAQDQLRAAIASLHQPAAPPATEESVLQGTSIAAAKVTGAASLIWAANPDLTAAQIKDILKASATDLGEPGWDAFTGAGTLNLLAAVQMARTTSPDLFAAVPGLALDPDSFWQADPGETSGERENGWLRNVVKKVSNAVKNVVSKVAPIVNKVFSFVGKVSGWVNKVTGFWGNLKNIWSKVSPVFKRVSAFLGNLACRFPVLGVLGKVGLVVGGAALVGGAIAGIISLFRRKKAAAATPDPAPAPATLPPEITALQGVWAGLPLNVQTALKKGVTSVYGRPLLSGDPDNVLGIMSTLSGLAPADQALLLNEALRGGVPAVWQTFFNDPTQPPNAGIPADLVTLWRDRLTPAQRATLLPVMTSAKLQPYKPLFDGTDPDQIKPLLSDITGLSDKQRDAIAPFLPAGILADFQALFP